MYKRLTLFLDYILEASWEIRYASNIESCGIEISDMVEKSCLDLVIKQI